MSTVIHYDMREASALFAAFAAAFRYPEEHQASWLTGVEFLAAFDPGASEEAVSLNEGAYANVDISSVFEELVRFYEHFGLRRHEKAELPDHLSIELEFMHFLCELEVASASNPDELKSVRAAQRDFLDRHLLKLLKSVQQARTEKAAAETRVTVLLNNCLELAEEHRRSVTE